MDEAYCTMMTLFIYLGRGNWYQQVRREEGEVKVEPEECWVPGEKVRVSD